MFTQVSETNFIDAFKALRPENFSYQGLKALFAYLEDYETDTGTPVEMDVIAICCEYSEYQNLDDLLAEYEIADNMFYDLRDIKNLEQLRDYTIVIPISEEFTSIDINGIMSSNKEAFIIQAF